MIFLYQFFLSIQLEDRLIGMEVVTPAETVRAGATGLSTREAAEAVPAESVRHNGNYPILQE